MSPENTFHLIQFLFPAILYIFALYAPPPWFKTNYFLGKNVFLVNISALLAGILVPLTVFAQYELNRSASAMFLAAAYSILGFLLVHSTFTDFLAQKADRWLLRFATVLSLLIFFVISSIDLDWKTITATLITFTISLLLIFIPGMGASDGRAIALTALLVTPIIGYYGFACAIICLTIMIAVGTVALKLVRRGKKHEKVFIPAVPLVFMSALLSLFLFPSLSLIF